jgi:hypothetical protein
METVGTIKPEPIIHPELIFLIRKRGFHEFISLFCIDLKCSSNRLKIPTPTRDGCREDHLVIFIDIHHLVSERYYYLTESSRNWSLWLWCTIPLITLSLDEICTLVLGFFAECS